MAVTNVNTTAAAITRHEWRVQTFTINTILDLNMINMIWSSSLCERIGQALFSKPSAIQCVPAMLREGTIGAETVCILRPMNHPIRSTGWLLPIGNSHGCPGEQSEAISA
jgi:hypothetical protein